MTTTDYDPLLNPPLTGDDLAEIRQRIHDAARAYQQLGGMLPDPIHMALALDVPHLLGEVERLRAERAGMLRLVRDLADDDDCWFDHHGGCQAHGYLSLEPGEKCPQQEAKELITAVDNLTDKEN